MAGSRQQGSPPSRSFTFGVVLSSVPVVVVALVAFVAVTLAAESFHNGIKHNGTQDIRPHRITDRKGK